MIGTNLAITTKRFVPLGGAAIDTDAQAFITAAGITNATQQSAVNQLVLDLKSANIWTKMKAIYPIVGGTASSHKWNLKDPRDLDAAFRLTFATGWTHSSTGMLPTSAYANTFLAANVMGQNSVHLSAYIRTNGTGIYIGSAENRFWFTPNLNGTSGFSELNTGAPDVGASYTRSLNTAMWVVSRTAGTTTKTFNKGSLIHTNTLTSRTPNTYNQYIGARNNANTADNFTNTQFSLVSFGDGLTDAEIGNLTTAVNTYQTTLGRNV
jgi:hypothetical protein